MWVKVYKKLCGTIRCRIFYYSVVHVPGTYIYPVPVLRKVVTNDYLNVPMSGFQCRSVHLFVIIDIEIRAFDIYNSIVALEQCSISVNRTVYISMEYLNVEKM